MNAISSKGTHMYRGPPVWYFCCKQYTISCSCLLDRGPPVRYLCYCSIFLLVFSLLPPLSCHTEAGAMTECKVCGLRMLATYVTVPSFMGAGRYWCFVRFLFHRHNRASTCVCTIFGLFQNRSD